MPADSNHLYPAGQPRVSRVVGGELPRASAADAARTLAATNTAGTLSTLSVDPAGYPFGSVVSFTVDADGDPLFVISRLAVHTTNVLADPRASLLVAEAVDAGIDPLARGRVTLLGDVAPVPSAEQETAVEAVASRVPGRCRLRVVRGLRLLPPSRPGRSMGRRLRRDGLGRQRRLSRRDGRPRAPRSPRIIAHMEDDHADAGLMLCSQALGAPVDVCVDAPRRPLRVRVHGPPRRRRGDRTTGVLDTGDRSG